MKKDTTFSIRISSIDLDTIKHKAKQARMSQSDYVTRCCLGRQVVVIEDLKETAKQLRSIGNMEFYRLLCIYIDKTDGLPLGYQTSQLLALLFLDEFDHYIQEVRGFRYYGCHMNDFYIIARTKEELQALLKEIQKWMDGLRLELNEKTGIFPLRNGIDFLGFHTYLTDSGKVVQKLRREKVEDIRARVKYWRTAYPAGEITKEEIIKKFGGWDAHAAHGDTHALRQKYADQVSEIIGEKIKPCRKINSTNIACAKRRFRQERNIRKKRGEDPAKAATLRSVPLPDDVPPWM